MKPHHLDNVGLSLDIYVDTKGVNEDDPDDMFFQSDDEDEENTMKIIISERTCALAQDKGLAQ